MNELICNNGYPQEQNIDGVYCRVERSGIWCEHCFTDLTLDEQINLLKGFDAEGQKRMCLYLASLFRNIVNQDDNGNGR